MAAQPENPRGGVEPRLHPSAANGDDNLFVDALQLTACVFVAEYAVMSLLPVLAPDLTGTAEALSNCLLLSLLIAPWFLLRLHRRRHRARNATQQLQASEARFRQFFELSPVGVAINELATGAFLDCNQALPAFLGYTREQFAALSYWDITPRDFEAQEAVQLQHLRELGRYGPYEKEYLHRDGHRVPVLLQGVRATEPSGREVIWSVVQDITERILAERTLAESEARFRAIADATPVMIWLSGTDKLCTDFNRAWLEFTGRTLEQEQGTGWVEGVHADDLQRCVTVYEQSFEQRLPFEMEYRLRRADGVYRWIVDHGHPRLAPDGHFLGYVGGCMDVTDRRHALAALKEAAATNQRLATAVEAAGDAVVLTDADGRITDVNSAFTRLSGYALAEVAGRTPAMLKSGRTDDAVYAELWTTIRAGRQWSGRLCNRRNPAGQPGAQLALYWVDVTITPMLDADHQVYGYVAVQRDATAEVAAAESMALAREGAETRARVAELLATEAPLVERLGAALDAVLDMRQLHCQRQGGVFELADDGTRLRLLLHRGTFPAGFPVEAAEAQLGSSQADRAAVGRAVLVSDRCNADRRHEPSCVASAAHDHYIVPLQQGNTCHGAMLLFTDPCPSRDTARLEALMQIGDLMALAFERERTRLSLVEARERAEAASRAKSEFLANMSHEIRSPMTAILGFTELLAEEGDLGKAPQRRIDYIQTIRRNGEHLLTIINDVLDIARIEAGKLSLETIDCSPGQIVEDVRSLMQVRATDKRIALEVEYLTELPARIQTDPTRLRQVLMNLLGNAIKFTEQGGVILRVRLQPQPSPTLQFDFVDTGIGISPQQMARLFEAFEQADASTTRRFGGSGLGLRISRRLAEMLGGEIHARSEPGRGSTFTFTLPVGDLSHVPMMVPGQRADEAPLPQAEPTSLALQDLRVLLAEDGVDNQRLISHILRRAGARVSVVENGRQLLESLLQDGRLDAPLQPSPEVDLILTDMQMPEMDGYTATRLLRARGCQLPIVALTAHAMADAEQGCLDAGCDSYASKPIDRTRLLQVCLQAIEQRR